ncbi:MAG TPA: PAS domain S-box protein, partial [Syntrophorhabdaceae bacterium]|nr:PAS domain S-box protein [Syntrophorhabdaceae bacterium]
MDQERLQELPSLKRRIKELEQSEVMQKRADEASRQSEVEHLRLFETMSQGVIYLTGSGEIISANPAAQRILGLPLDRMQGKRYVNPDWKLVRKDGSDLPDEEHPFRVVLRTGKPVEHFILGISNPVRKALSWLSITQTPLFRPGESTPYQVYAIFDDVTSQMHAEEALRESEKHYRSLFDNMLNGFAYCRMLFEENQPKDFIYLNVNDAFESLTGLKDVIGKKVSELIPGIREEDPELFEIYGKVALTGVPERLERYVKALGMWFSISVYSPRKEHFVAIFDVITERKRAEEALRTSQLQLSEATDLAHIVYWEVDPAAQTFILNDPFYALYGTTAEQEGGYRMTREEYAKRFIHPDDLPIFSQAVKQAVTRMSPEPLPDIEHRIIRRDGEVRHILTRAGAVTDDAGRVVKRYGVNQDITERKLAEQKVVESEQSLRDILAASPIGIGRVRDRVIEWVNESMSRISGYTFQELKGQSTRLLHETDETFKAVGESLYTTGQAEHRLVRKDGTTRDVFVQISTTGSYSFTFTVTDVTQLKEAQNALRKSELLYRTLVETSSEVLMLFDANRRRTYVSPNVTKMFGYSVEEFLARDQAEFTHPDSMPVVLSMRSWNLEHPGELITFEAQNRHKDGSWLWVEATARNMLEDPNVNAMVLNLRDITERKRAEEALRQSEGRLRR